MLPQFDRELNFQEVFAVVLLVGWLNQSEDPSCKSILVFGGFCIYTLFYLYPLIDNEAFSCSNIHNAMLSLPSDTGVRLGWGKCYENIVPNSLKHYKHCKTIKAVKDEIILN